MQLVIHILNKTTREKGKYARVRFWFCAVVLDLVWIFLYLPTTDLLFFSFSLCLFVCQSLVRLCPRWSVRWVLAECLKILFTKSSSARRMSSSKGLGSSKGLKLRGLHLRLCTFGTTYVCVSVADVNFNIITVRTSREQVTFADLPTTAFIQIYKLQTPGVTRFTWEELQSYRVTWVGLSSAWLALCFLPYSCFGQITLLVDKWRVWVMRRL